MYAYQRASVEILILLLLSFVGPPSIIGASFTFLMVMVTTTSTLFGTCNGAIIGVTMRVGSPDRDYVCKFCVVRVLTVQCRPWPYFLIWPGGPVNA